MKHALSKLYDRFALAYVSVGLAVVGSKLIYTHPRAYKFLFYAFFRVAAILSPGESYSEYEDEIDDFYKQLKKKNTRLNSYLEGQ